MSEPTSLDNKIKADLEALKRERLNDCAPEMYEALEAALPFIDDACDAHSVMSESSVTDECRSLVSSIKDILAKCRGET